MQTIKDYLKQNGYTQERMANKLGVSVMAVNSLLTGRRKFGVKTATAWAKAFEKQPRPPPRPRPQNLNQR